MSHFILIKTMHFISRKELMFPLKKKKVPITGKFDWVLLVFFHTERHFGLPKQVSYSTTVV